MNLNQFLLWLIAISRQYDEMVEPRRFVVALALMIPGMALIAFPVASHPFLFMSGVIYLSLMLGLRLFCLRHRA